MLPLASARAADHQDCTKATVVLWGDGRHDDTTALNAWLGGENAIWGDSGAPVGPTINWHEFRLSAAIYVSGGTGRTIENFRMNWPERRETVTGGAIRAGNNPGAGPVTSGVRIVGGDAGEGKPFDMPDLPPMRPGASASCGIS